MNTGVIASRYAKALLKFVQENGTGKEVYSQSCILVAQIDGLPQLKRYLEEAADVSLDKKLNLIAAALGESPSPSIVRFLTLVYEHRREEMFSRMLHSFIEQYRRANNIMVGKLVTAVPNDDLCRRLEELFHEKTGAEVYLEESVDPELIGGFLFELEGRRLDASVSGQLECIRRQLVEKNNRIV